MLCVVFTEMEPVLSIFKKTVDSIILFYYTEMQNTFGY